MATDATSESGSANPSALEPGCNGQREGEAKRKLNRLNVRRGLELIRNSVSPRFVDIRRWFLKSCEPGPGTIPRAKWRVLARSELGLPRDQADEVFDAIAISSKIMPS